MRILDPIGGHRLAAPVRWVSVAWMAIALVAVPLVKAGTEDGSDLFDDLFLVGALRGALGLLLSYLLVRATAGAQPSIPETRR